MKSNASTKIQACSCLQNILPKNLIGRRPILQYFDGLDIAQAHEVPKLNPEWLIIGNTARSLVVDNSYEFGGSQKYSQAAEWFVEKIDLPQLNDFSEKNRFLRGKALSNMYHSLGDEVWSKKESSATYIVLGTLLQHTTTKELGFAQCRMTFVTHEPTSTMTQIWSILTYKQLTRTQLRDKRNTWIAVFVRP